MDIKKPKKKKSNYVSKPKPEKDNLTRKCLGRDCGKTFVAESRFYFMCKHCRETLS